MRVAGKYLIQRKLGAGSFGDVYLGLNTETNEEVAIKIEESHAKFPQLLAEAKIISALKGVGIPKVYWYGSEGTFNIMVLELLGPSLEDHFSKFSRVFSRKSIGQIAEQLFLRIEAVHSQNYLHRDIKPDNFLTGTGAKDGTVYIIDFGLSKKYRDSVTKQHIKFSDKRALTGTARYASINSHMGNELSRRDDIEAIVYVIVYLFCGELPWQGITCQNKTEKYRMILDVKLNTSPDNLCRNAAPEIAAILSYSRGLKFEETPDYRLIQNQLKGLASREGLVFDNVFEWNTPVEEKKNKKKGKKHKKGKGKAEEKPSKAGKRQTVKEDDVPTCFATTRWPEFQDRTMVFSKLQEETGIKFNNSDDIPTWSSNCIIF